MRNLKDIQIPFCGFYESEASAMIDDELESVFDYSDGGGRSNIPDAVYYKADYKKAEIELVKAYVEAFEAQYEAETGILLGLEFDEMTSPREYNFSTDRVFCKLPMESVELLFKESEKDSHKELAKEIKEHCTSYSGFISFYSNNLADWLEKPIVDWDHNELKILLQAVLNIHYCEENNGYGHFSIYELLDQWRGNGGLSNAVWSMLPEELCTFADVQRDYGKALDYDLWLSTGKAYAEGADESEEPLPEPRCKETLELPLEARQ